MPLVPDSSNLVGGRLTVSPVYGYGWVLLTREGILKEIAVPPPFELLVTEVLFDEDEARAIIGGIDLVLDGTECLWAALKPRTTRSIDLRVNSVECAMLLGSSKPYLCPEFSHPHPAQIQIEKEPYIRGSARIFLSGPEVKGANIRR
jgi:hypothetical protein